MRANRESTGEFGGRAILEAVDKEKFTEILNGSGRAIPDQLLDQIYGELRRVAAGIMRLERPGHSLQPTELVNQAYLKLVDQSRMELRGRTHFIALGAQAMRRILMDHARGRGRNKRGGGLLRVTLTDSIAGALGQRLSPEDLLALNQALVTLETGDPRQGRIVGLKFFSGWTTAEIADHLRISTRTVEMEWTHARAWLRRELAK